MFTINCKGKLISTEMPLVMGIINATPDSFYQGDLQKGMDGILAMVDNMQAEGADIIDIGGQSSKPGSKPISVEQELERVIPVIEMVQQHFPALIISVDTYQSQVAQAAVAAGASMVNDISAGALDAAMLQTVGAMRNVPYVCMHLKGTPETMQAEAHYSNITQEVIAYFIDKLAKCKAAGIVDVIIDPGFGFAKTATHNFALLQNLSALQMLDKPILAGLSRKSTIYKTLGISAAEALNGTTVLNTLALQNGANILRVHDVRAAKEAVLLLQAYNNC